jgi:hypothetical protein
MLIAVLLIAGMAILGLTAIFIATVDTRISSNRYSAARALSAADAGINHAVALLNNGSIDEPDDLSGWERTSGGEIPLEDGSSYRWVMHLKRDADDLDRDGDTSETVFFNRRFRYGSSVFTGSRDDEGYPVVEILSDGFAPGGEVSRKVALELGRNGMKPAVRGALTARGSVRLSGFVTIDGRNHTLNGATGGTCGQDLPGVFTDAGREIAAGSSVRLLGNPPRFINNLLLPVASTPAEALGLSPRDMPRPLPADRIGELFPGGRTEGFVLVTGDHILTGGKGVLVVHNPEWDPAVWAVSCPDSPLYDPAAQRYSPQSDSSMMDDYDPATAPALLSASGGGIFEGIVIADAMDGTSGSVTILGALFVLDGTGATLVGPGPTKVLYSCEAVEEATRRGYTTRLAWHIL